VKLSDALGGWKVLLASYGWITLALAVVWMFFFQDFEQVPNAQNNADTKKEELRIALTSRITWGMIVQYVGGLLMMLAAFTYLPTYYAKYANFGADSVAHYAPSANQAGIMVAAFVSMWLKSLGIHYKKMFGITSILMAILIMIMLFSTNDYIVLACSFGAGFLLATWFAFIFALPKEEIRGATTNVITYVMSTFWFFSFSIAAINNQIIGHLVDQSGSFTSAFVYIIGVMVIAPIAAQFIFPKAK
jgi:cyanate permease